MVYLLSESPESFPNSFLTESYFCRCPPLPYRKVTPAPGPGVHPGVKRTKVSNPKQFLIITMRSLAETALHSLSRSFPPLPLNHSVSLWCVAFQVGPFAVLAKVFYTFARQVPVSSRKSSSAHSRKSDTFL